MSVVQYVGADDLTITDAYGQHTYRAPNGPGSAVFYVDSEHPHVLAHPSRFRPAPTGRGGARAFAERDRSRSSVTLGPVQLGGVHVTGRDLKPELYRELLAAVQSVKSGGARVGPIRHQRTTNPQLVRSRAEHRARQGSEGRCVYRGVVERSAGIRPKALDEVRQFQRRDRGKEVGGIVFVASWPSSGDPVRIAAVSGPRPGQVLYEDRFVHDAAWDWREIARLGEHGFLPIGAFHSHVLGAGSPSQSDMDGWAVLREALGLDYVIGLVLDARSGAPGTPRLYRVQARDRFRGDVVDVCQPCRLA